MVITIEPGTPEEQIEAVIKKLNTKGFDVHRSTGINRTVLGVIGNTGQLDIRDIKIMEGVSNAHRISEPYKLASRSYHHENTIINIKDVIIGGDEVVIIAGPCSVESREQLMTIAENVSKNGAKILRGGAFKPRTSPYAFQGMGEDGLKLLREAADKFNLVVITEVMDKDQIELVSKYSDIFYI